MDKIYVERGRSIGIWTFKKMTCPVNIAVKKHIAPLNRCKKSMCPVKMAVQKNFMPRMDAIKKVSAPYKVTTKKVPAPFATTFKFSEISQFSCQFVRKWQKIHKIWFDILKVQNLLFPIVSSDFLYFRSFTSKNCLKVSHFCKNVNFGLCCRERNLDLF